MHYAPYITIIKPKCNTAVNYFTNKQFIIQCYNYIHIKYPLQSYCSILGSKSNGLLAVRCPLICKQYNTSH